MNAPAKPTAGVEPQKSNRLTKLAGLVGVGGAALLFVSVPLEESGRTVEAKAEGAAVVVKHVSGPRHLKAYRDIVGVWTGCDGIAYVPANAVFVPAQCDELLERELVKHATGVLACTPLLKAPGRDYQRAAAVSLAYNVGVGAYCRSTVDRRFDAARWAEGCAAFAMWNKAGGRVVKGLDNRRKRERETCETNVVAGKTPANLQQRLKRLG